MVVKHRGYKAELAGTTLYITDWNEHVVKKIPWWRFCYVMDVEGQMREEVDAFISRAPYTRESWWADEIPAD